MIEFGTGANKARVACLTLRDEQQIELRLRKKPDQPQRTVLLWEPSAIEYARLRKAALAADEELAQAFPRPPDPVDRLPDESDVDRAMRHGAYQRAMADWLDERHNYRTDEDHAPYAKVLIEAVKTLSTESVTLDDLTAETFKAQPIQALLEVWETPLDGLVSPVVEETPPTPTAETPSAASPESTPSSPPGGEHSPPSPLPSSTE